MNDNIFKTKDNSGIAEDKYNYIFFCFVICNT